GAVAKRKPSKGGVSGPCGVGAERAQPCGRVPRCGGVAEQRRETDGGIVLPRDVVVESMRAESRVLGTRGVAGERVGAGGRVVITRGAEGECMGAARRVKPSRAVAVQRIGAGGCVEGTCQREVPGILTEKRVLCADVVEERHAPLPDIARDVYIAVVTHLKRRAPT